MQTTNSPGRPRVVIVGCGFGGLEAARKLQGADVDVTVIDRTNHHLFQPLLYQVATAGLAAPSIAAPVRGLFRGQANITTLLGEVSAIDPAARTVRMADGNPVPYDHLIVAAGATHSYFGRDEWSANAPGLKTLADAFEIRRRVLLSFETAELTTDAQRRRALLTFVVIGAGPTGVEMAGTLAEIAKHTLAGEFRHIDPASAQVLLVEGGPRVLQAMPEGLSQKALEQLEKLGVEVRLNARVTAIDATGLEVQTGGGADGAPAQSYRIDSSCVVWAAGVAASPLGRMLGSATGVECDRAGRIKVEPDLSLAGHPEISVVGDLAAAMSHAPAPRPPTSCAASRASPRRPSATATTATSRPSAATRPWSTSARPSARCASAAGSHGCSGCSRTRTS
jgi:NADH dehydrogenase